MLWASGVDIGEGNKSFIKNALGDAFEETWNMANSCIIIIKNSSFYQVM